VYISVVLDVLLLGLKFFYYFVAIYAGEFIESEFGSMIKQSGS
jgi:hypothetical protein